MISIRGALVLLLIFALAACGRIIPPATEAPPSQRPTERSTVPVPLPAPTAPPAVQPGENAVGAGIASGPRVDELLPNAATVQRAYYAFRRSCPSLTNRADVSGLTNRAEWNSVCERAATTTADNASLFFTENFSAVQVGDGTAFVTGYYEPEIAAAREQSEAYPWPIYGVPSDLPGTTNGAPPIPYLDRAAIEAGGLAEQGLEVAWARDLVDLYFMQVQGSGLLRLPDGDAIRIGYAANNGHPYVSIGAVMRDRDLLAQGQLTAEGIAQWLRENSDEGRAIMQENRRYIFFRQLETSAPLGSLGYPVMPRTTVAADPNYVPLGAPVILDMEHDIADGLWVAQDQGGAITGANRFDTYWGSGAEAYSVASGMASRGVAWILIPRASADRLARAD